MTDPFLHDDAAYVLGALSDDERVAFEEHLATCDECRARIAEIQPVAALLGDLTIDDLADPAVGDPGPPDTLLPALRATIRRERRRRWAVAGIVGAAAACIVALAVVVTSNGHDAKQSPALAMRSLVATPLHASARLDDRDWGTRITLDCQYENYPPDQVYKLVITDRSGKTQDAGSWRLAQGGTTHFTSGTAVKRSDIARIDITVDTTPVLELVP